MSKQKPLSIVGGPDRLHLAFCLLNGNNQTQIPVFFPVKNTETGQEWVETVKLNTIKREDGSGNNFNMTGYNTANSAHVTIFYSLLHRQGHMTFN